MNFSSNKAEEDDLLSGISYKGNSKIINDVVIDTGAAGSIISPDAVDVLAYRLNLMTE